MMKLEIYIKIIISIGLIVAFYFLFGTEIVNKLEAKDIETTRNEEETSIIPSPGLPKQWLIDNTYINEHWMNL